MMAVLVMLLFFLFWFLFLFVWNVRTTEFIQTRHGRPANTSTTGRGLSATYFASANYSLV